jgi:hypothetical protein
MWLEDALSGTRVSFSTVGSVMSSRRWPKPSTRGGANCSTDGFGPSSRRERVYGYRHRLEASTWRRNCIVITSG